MESSRVEAFASVVLVEAASVRALAYRLTNNEADAEDIAQEALLRAWKYFSTFQDGAAWPWLRTIVCNTWRTWKTQREPAWDPAETAPRSFCPEVDGRLAVREAIGRLPGELRTTLVGHDVAGLSGKEIAQCLGVPRQTVYRRLRRARLELRRVLSGLR